MEAIYIANPEQAAIIETVRRFVEDEVTPRAAKLDANVDPRDCFSWEIVEKADALGVGTRTVAEEAGGPQPDAVRIAVVLEDLAKGDSGVSVVIAQALKS